MSYLNELVAELLRSKAEMEETLATVADRWNSGLATSSAVKGITDGTSNQNLLGALERLDEVIDHLDQTRYSLLGYIEGVNVYLSQIGGPN